MVLYMNMKQLGKRRNTVNQVPFTYAQIDDMAQIGKIAFGIVYGEKAPDVGKSIETAMLGFQDGLFRVFLGETELTELDEKLKLQDGDTVTFIRLTMLAGRMW